MTFDDIYLRFKEICMHDPGTLRVKKNEEPCWEGENKNGKKSGY